MCWAEILSCRENSNAIRGNNYLKISGKELQIKQIQRKSQSGLVLGGNPLPKGEIYIQSGGNVCLEILG
jgi:phage repressor protein C with HTH and peptisase S24 domain